MREPAGPWAVVLAAACLGAVLTGPVAGADPSPTPTPPATGFTPSPSGTVAPSPSSGTATTSRTAPKGPDDVTQALEFPSLQPVVPPLQPVDVGPESPLPLRQQRQIRRDLADPALGPDVQSLVDDGAGPVGGVSGPQRAVMPASTLKLLTATAALQLLGPQQRVTTTVVQGDNRREVVLVGGGDATLTATTSRSQAPRYWAPAALSDLARATARSLRDAGTRSVRVAYDDSLFTGPAVSPAWEDEYVDTGVVAPVTALMVDQALLDPATESLARAADPALQAAQRFAELLTREGVRVRGAVDTAAPGIDGSAIAAVRSPPMEWLVERMLTDSDNQLAEALGRLAAAAAGQPASFEGVSRTLRAVALRSSSRSAVQGLRVDDASGLARSDRLTATLLVRLLQQAADGRELRTLCSSLPVAGFTGTLVDRYLQLPASQAAGEVRAKTGTLTGVSAETGLVVDASGTLRLFAFLADRVVDLDAARAAMDRAASRLAP